MNPYASSTRWRKVAPGIYQSPCGRWRAIRVRHSSWRLVDCAGVDRGPYVSLAECQEAAAGVLAPVFTGSHGQT